MLIHNDQRPHKCSICGAGFKGKKQLANHFSGHSNDKTYKVILPEFKQLHLKFYWFQFQCPQCNYYAPSLRKITAHRMRSHSGRVICGVCNGILNNKRSLRNHLNDIHGLSKENTTKYVRTAKFVQSQENSMFS
jgi:transcription elongation factor Elf1